MHLNAVAVGPVECNCTSEAWVYADKDCHTWSRILMQLKLRKKKIASAVRSRRVGSCPSIFARLVCRTRMPSASSHLMRWFHCSFFCFIFPPGLLVVLHT